MTRGDLAALPPHLRVDAVRELGRRLRADLAAADATTRFVASLDAIAARAREFADRLGELSDRDVEAAS